MTDKYKDLRDAARRRSLFCHPDVISAYRAYSTPEVILSLLAERDALREALRWTAATLQDATSSLEMVFDEDHITLEGETKTVTQILDAADAALAQHQGEKHD